MWDSILKNAPFYVCQSIAQEQCQITCAFVFISLLCTALSIKKEVFGLFKDDFEMHGFVLIPAEHSSTIETLLAIFLPLWPASSSLSTCFSGSWVAHHVTSFTRVFLADNVRLQMLFLSLWVSRWLLLCQSAEVLMMCNLAAGLRSAHKL